MLSEGFICIVECFERCIPDVIELLQKFKISLSLNLILNEIQKQKSHLRLAHLPFNVCPHQFTREQILDGSNGLALGCP